MEKELQPELKVMGTLEQSGYDHGKRVYDPEGISPTLTAVSGGTHHIKIFDPTKYRVRKLTPKEYGRLQAFPVDNGWEQVVSDSQAYKQFGNAVTTTVVTAIAENIKIFLDLNSPQAEETDLSDAPEEIKEEIIRNAELLSEKKDEPKVIGLEFFSNEELLAELQRRMVKA